MKKALSKRELEIINLLANGHTVSEISTRLNISESTVVTHKTNIQMKLDARNSCQVIYLCSKLQLLA